MCSAPGVGFSQGVAPLALKPGCGAQERRTGAFWVPTDAPRWVRAGGPRRGPVSSASWLAMCRPGTIFREQFSPNTMRGVETKTDKPPENRPSPLRGHLRHPSARLIAVAHNFIYPTSIEDAWSTARFSIYRNSLSKKIVFFEKFRNLRKLRSRCRRVVIGRWIHGSGSPVLRL